MMQLQIHVETEQQPFKKKQLKNTFFTTSHHITAPWVMAKANSALSEHNTSKNILMTQPMEHQSEHNTSKNVLMTRPTEWQSNWSDRAHEWMIEWTQHGIGKCKTQLKPFTALLQHESFNGEHTQSIMTWHGQHNQTTRPHNINKMAIQLKWQSKWTNEHKQTHTAETIHSIAAAWDIAWISGAHSKLQKKISALFIQTQQKQKKTINLKTTNNRQQATQSHALWTCHHLTFTLPPENDIIIAPMLWLWTQVKHSESWANCALFWQDSHDNSLKWP